MTPWAKDQLKAAKPSFGPKAVILSETNDPVYKCHPPGVPRVYFHPLPMQFAVIPGQVFLIYEYDHTVRHIFTDGRKHPEDVAESWMGHSTGTWDGDALAVDTVGYDERSWLDRFGRAHSNQLHTVERIRRLDAKSLQIELTIDDPKAYTQPFSSIFTFQLEPKWDLTEQDCTDNDGFTGFEDTGAATRK